MLIHIDRWENCLICKVNQTRKWKGGGGGGEGKMKERQTEKQTDRDRGSD